MKRKINDLIRSIFSDGFKAEGFRYIVIGVMTTLINLVLFYILYRLLSIDVNVSNVISITSAIIFAYFGNKIVVFKRNYTSVSYSFWAFVEFFAGRLFMMAVEVFLVYLFVSIAGQDPFIGKLETQIIVIVGNYLLSKFLIFRKR